MDDPKVKFEVVMRAALEAAKVVDADDDLEIAMCTQRLMPNDTIELDNYRIHLKEWKKQNALAVFEVQASLGVVVWKYHIKGWSAIPEALAALDKNVTAAQECLNAAALERLYKEAAEAVVTLHGALDPLLTATLQEERAEVTPEIVEAVREYLKHKTFLEKHGVIRTQYAGYRPRHVPTPSSSAAGVTDLRTRQTCEHFFFQPGCLNCDTRRREKACNHAMPVSNCNDCTAWTFGHGRPKCYAHAYFRSNCVRCRAINAAQIREAVASSGIEACDHHGRPQYKCDFCQARHGEICGHYPKAGCAQCDFWLRARNSMGFELDLNHVKPTDGDDSDDDDSDDDFRTSDDDAMHPANLPKYGR